MPNLSPVDRDIRGFSRRRIQIPRPLLIGLTAALCAAFPSLAQEAVEKTVPLTLEESPGSAFEAQVSEPTFDLTLEEAMAAALEHNLSLVIQRYERRRSILGIDAALGIYDFNLIADVSSSSSTRPRGSALEQVVGDVTSDADVANFRVDRRTPWGGLGDITFNNRRNASSDANVQPNPQYSLGLFVGYEQPLLRNFGRDVTEREILIARSNVAINRETFRGEVESIVQQVSDRYWDLVEARQQLAVSEESLKLARELHEMNRIQVEVGTKAPLEMVQSEVGVATREEEIVRRQAAVEDAEDQLRRLMNLAQSELLWNRDVVPLTPPEIPFVTVNVADAVEIARSKRADVQRVVLGLDQLRLDARIARNRTLPQLNVAVGYGFNALAGEVDFIDPATGERIQVREGYGDAFSQITDRDYDGWEFGVNFAYPLGNRTARARVAQAELLVEQREFELRDLQDQIQLDVRRAARAVETAAKTIELARVSSTLARKNLEAEQKRYENGLSTSFQVLEIQEDLSQALSREVSAVIAYRKQLANLYRVTGELLEKTQIRLEE
jgi:outer membrane protein TolC